jgi:hypothetical protein
MLGNSETRRLKNPMFDIVPDACKIRGDANEKGTAEILAHPVHVLSHEHRGTQMLDGPPHLDEEPVSGIVLSLWSGLRETLTGEAAQNDVAVTDVLDLSVEAIRGYVSNERTVVDISGVASNGSGISVTGVDDLKPLVAEAKV